MTTRFYNQIKLEGQYIDLPYGNYLNSQISVLPIGILSINVPPHALVTLYSQDSYMGVSYAIANYGNKSLKVPGFATEFPYTVVSLKIECSCKVSFAPDDVVYTITQGDFVRSGQVEIAYSFYYVVPPPMREYNDPPRPYNPTILIIPDFGTDMKIYQCFQEKLAYHRFSSIILDLRGVGLSYPSTSVTYADIIQDYRYIAAQLNQTVKKPIVIGHGVGGAIAQVWALTYKFELRNLILIDTAPYSVYSTYNLLDIVTDNWIDNNITTATFATNVADAVYNTPSEECQVAKLKKDLIDSINTADTPTLKLLFTQNPDVPALELAPKYILTPTLIIHGLYDDAVSILGGDALYGLIKGAKYRKIGTGHSPILTTPARTLETIINFLLPNGGVWMDPLPSCP